MNKNKKFLIDNLNNDRNSEQYFNCKCSKVKEEVNHPERYGGDTTYECIKVLEAWMSPEEYEGFLKGNAIKLNIFAELERKMKLFRN